jgi:hypothetical protein
LATADDADDNHETLCCASVDDGSVPRQPNRNGRFCLGCAYGVAGHSRRPFLIGIAHLDPRPRRKSGCTAIAAPSHSQTMASADASRTPNEDPSWLRGDDRTGSALLLALQLGEPSLLCIRNVREGHTYAYPQPKSLSSPDVSTDHYAVCATTRQVPDCNEPHSYRPLCR